MPKPHVINPSASPDASSPFQELSISVDEDRGNRNPPRREITRGTSPSPARGSETPLHLFHNKSSDHNMKHNKVSSESHHIDCPHCMESKAKAFLSLPTIETILMLKKMGAELMGTFALVFVGCGSILIDDRTPGSVGHVGISLAFGLAVMTMVYTVGHISGSHLNPALSIALASVGRFSWREVPGYIGAQILASVSACLSLQALFANHAAQLITTTPGPNIHYRRALVVEAITTGIVSFVVTGTATDTLATKGTAGVSIGLAVTMLAIFSGPLTGASMNPARSIAPALLTGNYNSISVYIIGPILGAIIGAFLYVAVCLPPPPAKVVDEFSFKAEKGFEKSVK